MCNSMYSEHIHSEGWQYVRLFMSSMLTHSHSSTAHGLLCSSGGSITNTGCMLNPGWGTLRRSSRPSRQRAHTWQNMWVARSQVDSHCSLRKSSSMQLTQQPEDLSRASHLPCWYLNILGRWCLQINLFHDKKSAKSLLIIPLTTVTTRSNIVKRYTARMQIMS